MERNHRLASRGTAGFSLIELLVVMGIIAVMAAVAIPALNEYLRNYRVRGATQEVASAIQDARTRAITRNLRDGVSFAVVSENRYRVISNNPAREAVASNPEDQLGVLRQLPLGVEFAPNPVGALDAGVTFSRLGALELYTFANPCKAAETTTCSNAPAVGFGVTATGNAVLRLIERQTGLWRDINIAPGGRIQQQD